MNAILSRRSVGCVSDLTIDRWLLGETPGSDEARRVEAHLSQCASCNSRVGALRGLYSTHVPEAAHERPAVLTELPASAPGQTGAMQILILRDGLLVGTELFTPGAYRIGSGAAAELQLDGVLPVHASLHFQGGRIAVKAEGGALFVNGFKVASAELRPVDEVLVGPYVLRSRVLRERGPEGERGAARRVEDASGGRERAEATRDRSESRREQQQAPRDREPVFRERAEDTRDRSESRREQQQAPRDREPVFRERGAAGRDRDASPGDSSSRAPVVRDRGAAARAPDVSRNDPPSRELVPGDRAAADRGGASCLRDSSSRGPGLRDRDVSRGDREASGLPSFGDATIIELRPAVPRTRLTLELWWGQSRQTVSSFLDRVHASDFPLWGLGVEEGFLLAEPEEDGGFLVHLPDGRTLSLAAGERQTVALGAMTLVGAVGPVLEPLPRAAVVAWPTLCLSAALLIALFGGMALAPTPGEAPFQPHDTARVIHILAPRLEPAPPIASSKPSREPLHSPLRRHPLAPPRPSQPGPIAALDRVLNSAGLQAVLHAKAPVGHAPGGHLAGVSGGLIGPGPASPGFSIGLPTGAERIGASGLAGSGELGRGSYGKGKVAGSVEQPSGKRVGLGAADAGHIDRDAVAKVIAEHLHEVSTCYEHALLTNGKAGGRLQLEWTISTGGIVTQAKVQSTTLKDGSIAACVMTQLKGWRFPPARGASVLVSYPFVFQSSSF